MEYGKEERHSDAKQDYGPGWADVRDLWDWVQKEHSCKLCLEVELVSSVDRKKGLKCVFKAKTTDALMGGVGFGPAYANGARTLPAALLMALYEVQHSIDQRLGAGLPWDHLALFEPSV